MPELRGRPVGVIPFETSAANSTVVIACSKEAACAAGRLASRRGRRRRSYPRRGPCPPSP
ncbi:MAG: hypothetical protein WBX25_00770 [Rhodomicrobium sp.]